MPFFGGGGGDYHIIGTNVKGGTNAAPAVIGDNNMALGNASLQNAVNVDGVISIGNNAGQQINNISADNIIIGFDAVVTALNVNKCVIIGTDSRQQSGDSESDVFIGYRARVEFDNRPSINNVVIGSDAYLYGFPGVYKNNVVVGALSRATSDSVVIGFNSFAQNDSVIVGNGINAPSDGSVIVGYPNGFGGIFGVSIVPGGALVIGDNFQSSVVVGGVDLTALAGGDFEGRIYTPDYLAAGIDQNFATVDGAVISAKLALWVDDGGVADVGGGIGKAANTAQAGATFFMGRSRGTLAAPTIVQNGDVIGSLVAVGNDGTDFASSAIIDFEIDGVPGNNNMPGRIAFKTAPIGSQTPVERMQISADGTMVLSANSAGIRFPAVQVPVANANTLDDYEEGVFTPSFTCTVPGDLNVVYTAQQGRYVKIGRIVYFSLQILCTPTFTTASGDVRISGLPFVVAGNANCPYYTVGNIERWNAPARYNEICGDPIFNNTYAQFRRFSIANAVQSYVQMSEIPSGVISFYNMTGFYEV